MKATLKLVFVMVVALSHCKRPPWYKPCWIYLCGMDVTDPICAWDPRHGARLFRNDCEMDRHNFCYNRNYAIVDSGNDVEQDIKLCEKLKELVVENTDKPPSVAQDGNVQVHFLKDPNETSKRLKKPEATNESQNHRHKQWWKAGLFSDGRYRDHYPYRKGLRDYTFEEEDTFF